MKSKTPDANENRSPAPLQRELDRLVRKRDYAADVLGKPMLALSYQQEIDRMVESMKEV